MSATTAKLSSLNLKKVLTTKDFQQGKHKEPTMNENTEKEMLPAEHKIEQPTQKILHVSMATYVSTLTNAMMSSKYALNCELATALAIFTEMGGAHRNAKRTLLSVYAQAGWDCAKPSGLEYKTCSRRSIAASLLFERIGAEAIEGWIAGSAESQAIQCIVAGLEPLRLKSIDAVFAYCGRARLPAAKAAPQQIEGEQPKHQEDNAPKGGEGPSGGVAQQTKEQSSLEPGEIILEQPKGSVDEHTDKELPDDVQGPRWMRRAEDIEGATHLDSPSVHITIAPNADKNEILKIAKQLVALAEAMNGHQKETTKAAHKSPAKEKEQEPEGMLQAELRKVAEPMKPKGRRVIR